MTIIKGYKIRLLPTREQEVLMFLISNVVTRMAIQTVRLI